MDLSLLLLVTPMMPPLTPPGALAAGAPPRPPGCGAVVGLRRPAHRSEEHTSELQSQSNLVCRLLLEKKNDRHLQHFDCQYYQHAPGFHHSLDCRTHFDVAPPRNFCAVPEYAPRAISGTGSTCRLSRV